MFLLFRLALLPASITLSLSANLKFSDGVCGGVSNTDVPASLSANENGKVKLMVKKSA